MPAQFTDIGPLYTTTYTFLIGVGVLLICAGYLWRWGVTRARLDVCLGGVFGGLVVGRGLHVLFQWTYFQSHTDEITQFTAGGLDWRGALVGALLGLVIVARVRGIALREVYAVGVVALPLLGLMAWWGCGAAHCAYGREVDTLANYPAWLVWEERDIYTLIAPRYATQRIGMAFSAVLLVLGAVLLWRGWLPRYRSPLVVALFAAGMFGVAFLRGDYMPVVGGLRAGQWGDVLVMVFAVSSIRVLPATAEPGKL